MNVPEDRLYTTEHEWVLDEGDGRARVGITDYAQDALGDVVYVELPVEGRRVGQGDTVAEIESTKSVAEVYAPVPGTVLEANTGLSEAPEKVNADPYGDGWFFVMELAEDASLQDLLDASAYRALIE